MSKPLTEFLNKLNKNHQPLLDKLMNAGTSSTFRVGIRNEQEESGPVELLVYEGIGEDWDGTGVTAIGVRDFLNENKDRDVVVRINSPGGLVFDGIVIHNALTSHEGEVTTVVEGLAASAATLIAMAGDKRQIHENSMFMVHLAWGLVIGNAIELADMAKTMNKLDQQIAATLAAKSNLSAEEVYELMKGEVDGVYLTASETLEKGFATEVIKLAADEDEDDSDDATDDDDEDEEDDDLKDRMRNSLAADVQQRLTEIEQSVVNTRLEQIRQDEVSLRLSELDMETA